MAVSLAPRIDAAHAVLGALAAGAPRTAAGLAQQLDIARAQVEAAIGHLQAQGIDIAAAGAGAYRLAEPIELLDAARIGALLKERGAAALDELEVLLEVDSTNSYLLARPAPAAQCAHAVLAELQVAGRGRRGRPWIAPFGASLALSVGWRFPEAARAGSALSLAAGVAVCRALARVGASGTSLKWPNDVWLGRRKMGGILVELRTDAGAAHAVIGVGLNLFLSGESRRAIELRGTRPAALAEACPAGFSRNGVAAALLEELLSMLEAFERLGFAPFRDRWRSLDALEGRAARVLIGEDLVEGIARGVDEDGALLLESGGRLQKFISGDASLRPAPGDA